MSSGFITESEIADARKKRQDEWERVRKADDPIEAPEQPYDSRSLYERLQEQKQRKDLEYEEAHKLKNMIKGLDDDEIQFLELVDRSKIAADRKKNLEEEKELDDYRNRVASLQEKSYDQKLQAEANKSKPKAIAANRTSQTKLLKGVIVTKNEGKKRKSNSESESNMESSKKAKTEEGDSSSTLIAKETGDQTGGDVSRKSGNDTPQVGLTASTINSGLKCVAILPGLGYYDESSSECSSNSDQDIPFNDAKLDMFSYHKKKDKKT